jgi:uncharacterized pyridoxamine 5'-phosphate oxidase family protein
MDFKECIDFANENSLCYLATCENQQPHVRAFRMWKADEDGFHFITFSAKAVCKQLRANQAVEVCFFNNKQGEEANMMRVIGQVRFVNDETARQQAFESRRARLKNHAKDHNDTAFSVFSLYSGDVFFWGFKEILKEDQLERIRFGK